MSDKKTNKNPFLYFRIDEINRLKSLKPPVTKRSEINPIISARWASIKKDNSDEYKHYLKLASGINEDHNNKKSSHVSVNQPIYQVTKPFHKFSLMKRKEFETRYVGDNAIQITKRLVDSWNSLTKLEKKNWKL